MKNNPWENRPVPSIFSLLCTGFLLSFFFFVSCTEQGREESPKNPQAFHQIPFGAKLSRERAPALLERLRREQEEPGYREGYEAINRGQFEQAAELLRPLAEKGNSMAQYWLGRALTPIEGSPGRFGRRFLPYPSEGALRALEQSADQGNFYAMLRLGIYANDSGRMKQCEAYCTVLAELEDPEGLFCLFQVESWTNKPGFNWDTLFKAYLRGSEDALLRFARPVSDDIPTRLSWVSEDLRKDYPDLLDEILGKLKALADSGHPMAQYYYGNLTEFPKGRPYISEKWKHEGFPYLEKAANAMIMGPRLSLFVWYPLTPEYEEKLAYWYGIEALQRQEKYLDFELNLGGLASRVRHRRFTMTEEEFEEACSRGVRHYEAHPYEYVYNTPFSRFE